MTKKPKIYPNMVCGFDPENELAQQSYGLTHVRTIEVVKYRPFGRSIWKVKAIDHMGNENEEMECPERMLVPTNFGILRIPNDVPVFTKQDLQAVREAICICSGAVDINKNDKQLPINLAAVSSKIKFALKLRGERDVD